MELIFSNYRFNIKNNCINCIMGNGIILEQLEDACKNINNIEIIIHPVINSIIYSSVKEELINAFNLSTHHDNKKIIDSLKIVGLEKKYLNKKINELSSSELYLIKLACILLKNPKIIILDNPNIYLDLINRNNFIKIIRTIKKRYNKTIIIFSNNSNFVHSICDYLILINNKKIIKEGNKYEIFKDEKLLKKNQIKTPTIIELEKKIMNKKNINISLRDNINDLIKDICYFN